MSKYELRSCQHHGLVSFVREGRGYYRCVKCRVQRISDRRRKIKQQAVDYKGGKCEKCGYNRYIGALDFHHLDPKQKDFRLGSGSTISWDKTRAEVDKCILVCSNCHREIHGLLEPNEELHNSRNTE